MPNQSDAQRNDSLFLTAAAVCFTIGPVLSIPRIFITLLTDGMSWPYLIGVLKRDALLSFIAYVLIIAHAYHRRSTRTVASVAVLGALLGAPLTGAHAQEMSDKAVGELAASIDKDYTARTNANQNLPKDAAPFEIVTIFALGNQITSVTTPFWGTKGECEYEMPKLQNSSPAGMVLRAWCQTTTSTVH